MPTTDEPCGICLQPVPSDQMESKRDQLSLPPGPFEDTGLNLLSATEAWQCDRCRRWICNSCVLPFVTGSRGRRMRHRGCGGVFKAPDAPSWIGVDGQRAVAPGSWRARFGIRTV